MLIHIIIAIVLLLFAFYIVRLCFSRIKTLLEKVAGIVRFLIFGVMPVLFFSSVIMKIPNVFVQLLVGLVMAIVLWFVITLLCLAFRLVGYSANFMAYSFLLIILKSIFKDKIEVSSVIYLLVLFLLPRLMWLSDRVSTVTIITGTSSKYHMFTGALHEETHYVVEDTDAWGDSEGSWNLLLLQIILSIPFYFMGVFVSVEYSPIDSKWLYIGLAILINLLFDLLVFKNIEEPIVKALRWIRDKFGREKEGTISETTYNDGETYRSDSRL